MGLILRLCFLLLLVLTACSPKPNTSLYRQQYAYQTHHRPPSSAVSNSDYFLILLVNARHLDYSDGSTLLKTLAKHPSDGSKNSDVGHAWIYLHGIVDGKRLQVEGGHSGERGFSQPRYFEGLMNYLEYGYANPTPQQRQCPRYEPNPVKYLWEIRNDGFFQKGSGGHCPTYAIKINLTQEQFFAILEHIDPCNYDYAAYSLKGTQCASFVSEAAKIANLDLECQTSLKIPKNLILGKNCITLWEDPCYSHLILKTPDILERSMMLAVEEGKAEYSLPWYLKNVKNRRCPGCHRRDVCKTICKFPERICRVQLFKNIKALN